MSTSVQIHLNETEQQFFRVINEAILNSEEGSIYRSCEVRVAGGWVRDKVMGLENHDIDIAVSNMNGAQFATFLNDYLKQLNIETHTVSVIQSNPEQSKHLETATVQMLGMSIDFCNLRKEVYEDHSRIPTQEIGTPEEDALRRDLTINALFYNVLTGHVEDYTQHGLAHIREKIICTPIDPRITFKEDPLRILRAIRFTCRFEGFVMDDALIDAATSESVLHAFANKISKERIGIEFTGILKSRRPELGIYYIVLFGLHPIIFKTPFEISLHYPERQSIHYERQALRILRSFDTETFRQTIGVVNINRYTFLLSAPFSPYVGLTYKVKSKVFPVTHYMIVECLKLSSDDSKRVSQSLLAFHEISNLLVQLNQSGNDIGTLDRVVIGQILRRIGIHWFEAILLACLPHLPKFDSDIDKIQLDPIFEKMDPYIETCLVLRQYIIHQNLVGVWDMKPLLNGHDVMKLLQIKAGQQLRLILEEQINWILKNPNGTIEECTQWLLTLP